MIDNLKKILIFVGAGLVVLLIGMKFYNYFSYSGLPVINLQGIQRDGYSSGIIDCKLCSDNGYKINSAKVLLDGKGLDIPGANNIGRRVVNIPFSIDSKNLDDGKHTLEISMMDSSYNKNENK